MEVVHLLVGAYGVHVGIDAVARLDVVFGQCEAFPLGQRMDHLGLLVAHVAYGEADGPLDAVEVVVDAQSFHDEEWGGDAAQPQFCRQVLLEEFLDELDALLGLSCIEQSAIVVRSD